MSKFPHRYRVDYHIFGESGWATNAVRFDTREEAMVAGRRKANAWTLVHAMRVVPETTPDREAYVPGSEDLEVR